MDENSETNESRGMELYEYIVDHTDCIEPELGELVAKLRSADTSGQFLASTARYLAAVDRKRFDPWLGSLIEGAIEKDRERRYIGSLLEAIWGEGYMSRAEELKETDNNFRRVFRRIHNEADAM